MHRIDPMKRERATAVLVDFCHTKLRFQEKKIFLALPWENHGILIRPKNPISLSSLQFGQFFRTLVRIRTFFKKLVRKWSGFSYKSADVIKHGRIDIFQPRPF